jgi:hypothetical protein
MKPPRVNSKWVRKKDAANKPARVMGIIEDYVVLRYKASMPFLVHLPDWDREMLPYSAQLSSADLLARLLAIPVSWGLASQDMRKAKDFRRWVFLGQRGDWLVMFPADFHGTVVFTDADIEELRARGVLEAFVGDEPLVPKYRLKVLP